MARLEEDRTRSHAFGPRPPDRPRVLVFWAGGTETRDLEPGTSLVIGRGEECDLQVLHASVSRKHARLHVGPPLRIEDLGSSNGVRVDGVVMTRGGYPLAAGQIVEIGAAMLVVQGDLPSAQGAPPDVDFDRFIRLIARSQLSVLILGETGAGKEVVAETLHRLSTRAAGPFIRLNCAAFPLSLLESELFGHEKGAFTGAGQAKPGLIEAAHGGTLLLDEVGEMPPATQVALLRVLESREVLRIGALQPRAVDVRLLSATNRDLEALIAQGAFRRDLFYRLAGVTARVPPLRAQPARVTTLAQEFLIAAARLAESPPPELTTASKAALLAHEWPGNVRELRNVIERAFVLAEGKTIEPAHLLLEGHGGGPGPLDERTRVVQALEAAEGNQSRAAEILGVSRRTLINRIEEYGLPRPRKRG
jgi:two-component system response regulator AtoC